MPGSSTQRAAVALLVGIGDYQHAGRIAPLRYAKSDARALSQLLVDPKVCNFPQDRVVLLTDRRARRDKIVHYLSKWLPDHAQGAEIVVIYFAGHGMVQAAGQREEGYLLPFDADPEDVVTRGVSMSDVGRWIEGIGASAVVVCLDCCHAGKVVLRDAAPLAVTTRDMVIRPAVLQGMAGKGRFLIASCDEGQKSLEAEEFEHGLFTYHLLQGLAGAGDRDGDGKVGVAELFNYVSAAVAKDAREKYGREQRPWISSTWADDIHLSSPRPGAKPLFDAPSIEPPEGEDDPEEALRRLELEPADIAEPRIIRLLVRLRKKSDWVGLPAVFRCLANPSEKIRAHATKVVQAFGWEKTASAIEALAGRADVERMAFVLDGLAAFEAHAQVVSLLDRLVTLLKGDMRNRTILLLERKRLALDLDRVALLFREIKSPYRIEKALGQGMFAAAYLANIEGADLPVVVRVLRPEFVHQPLVRAQFLDTAQKSLRYVHQNLVLTREARAFADSHLYYAVRDYVEGVTLQTLIESGKKLDALQVVRIVRQILAALTPLHERGMAHGAIKPSNLFARTGDRIILGDPSVPVQGIGLALDRLSYDYRYAPPETFRSGGALVPGSDFYSLGCVAYELVCGQPPFVADNYHELAAMHMHKPIPAPATRGSPFGDAGDRFLMRLLAGSPAERFASLVEAAAALDAVEAATKTRLEVERARPSPPIMRADSMVRLQPLMSILPFEQSSVSSLDASGDAEVLLSKLPKVEESSYDVLDNELELESMPPTASMQSPAWQGRLDSPMQMSIQAPLLPGRIGQFEILGRIGHGAMGIIYKARDLRLERIVALKMLQPGIVQNREALYRFQKEARVVASLHHPNILPVFDFGEHDGASYFIMLFAAGGSLSEHLERYQDDPKAAADLVEKVARAVQYAHEREILHRDLKPGNILLDERGEPLVSDFGLARFHDSLSPDAGSTQTGTIMGTPAYMSPEQFRGESLQVTEAADIWSLGVILYQLLTGRLPFGGSELMKVMFEAITMEPPSPRGLRPELDQALEAICLKCLQKQPADRYPSAGALADELARWLRGESIQSSLVRARPQSAQALEASAPAASKSARAGSWFRRLFGN